MGSNLSPDVLVGRVEEAQLINGGAMEIRELKGERKHSASPTLRKYSQSVLHLSTYSPPLYSWEM